jgi:hypothetical protein
MSFKAYRRVISDSSCSLPARYRSSSRNVARCVRGSHEGADDPPLADNQVGAGELEAQRVEIVRQARDDDRPALPRGIEDPAHRDRICVRHADDGHIGPTGGRVELRRQRPGLLQRGQDVGRPESPCQIVSALVRIGDDDVCCSRVVSCLDGVDAGWIVQ